VLINDEKWLYRFLDVATLISGWSKDPSSKIGAVIVDHRRRIVSTGFNGFPIEVHDSDERYAIREIKYQMIMHAESNAIVHAGRDLSSCALIVMSQPCVRCAAMIVQAGIRQVAFRNPAGDERMSREPWASESAATWAMFREANVLTRLL
jgi:dCMP deaminase